jgi:Ca2+-binding RTX toxin-like protein
MEELDNFRSKGIRLPLVLVLLVLFIGLLSVVPTLIAQPPDLFVNQSHFDPNLFPHNDSRGMDIIQRNDITDYLLLTPPSTEFIIDCAHPSPPGFLLGNGNCFGSNSNDKMLGTAQVDRIVGHPGDDYIVGGKGSDDLSGHNGNDLIEAGEGDDEIMGSNGEDRIFAGSGNDLIYVGRSDAITNHNIYVNRTEDQPYKDFVDCGEGYDRIYVDTLDIYRNCEVVNGFNAREFTANQTVGDLIHNP